MLRRLPTLTSIDTDVILITSTGTTFFAPIAGVSTVASTFSAGAISKLAPKIGLSGLLCSGGLSLLLSYISVDKAYSIAEKVSKIEAVFS